MASRLGGSVHVVWWGTLNIFWMPTKATISGWSEKMCIHALCTSIYRRKYTPDQVLVWTTLYLSINKHLCTEAFAPSRISHVFVTARMFSDHSGAELSYKVKLNASAMWPTDQGNNGQNLVKIAYKTACNCSQRLPKESYLEVDDWQSYWYTMTIIKWLRT